MLGDDAEVAVDRSARMIGQGQRDADGEALFVRIMNECNDTSKLRKNLQPTRIYIGRKEFDTLRAWTGITRWHSIQRDGDTLAGYKYFVVGHETHLYVAWE